MLFVLRMSRIALVICIAIFISSSFAFGQYTSSNLPIIIIETNNQKIPDDPRISAVMKVIYHPSQTTFDFNSTNYQYNGKISIEIRGYSSQSFPKKQYALETQNEFGENLNVMLIDMPEENDWILYAPYSDKSLMRNVLAYQIARDMGNYATRTRYCELVLNNEYKGVYVLIEKIKRDRNRVDIAKIDKDDKSGDALTGGYIYKIDRSGTSKCKGWITQEGNMYLQLYYPLCKNATDEQLEYSHIFFEEFEHALFSDEFMDEIYGYRQFIDLNSFIDYFLVNELAKNIDAYRLSTFLHKNRDSQGGKLIMGPVWDFNIAFGNVVYRNGFQASSIVAHGNTWWNRFLQDSVFKKEVASRWNYHRNTTLSISHLMHLIDSFAIELNEAQERNFTCWDIMGKKTWPNYYVGSTYNSEIDYLKDWLINRINWLDNYFNNKLNPTIEIEQYITNLFPNPFSSFIAVEYVAKVGSKVVFSLYDLTGTLKMKITPEVQDYEYNIKTIRLGKKISEGFYSGIYILKMEVDGCLVDQKTVARY